jgi:hypothetical protein
VIEDVGGFIRKMDPFPENVEEAAVRLKKDYGIRIGSRWLKQIIEMERRFPEHGQHNHTEKMVGGMV